VIAIIVSVATQGLVEGCGRRQRDKAEWHLQSLLPFMLPGAPILRDQFQLESHFQGWGANYFIGNGRTNQIGEL
jgi:hypothetical protein